VKPYIVLDSGDVYDMKARRVVAQSIGNGRAGSPPGPGARGAGAAAGRAGGAGGGW
jgi:hypothetical protein